MPVIAPAPPSSIQGINLQSQALKVDREEREGFPISIIAKRTGMKLGHPDVAMHGDFMHHGNLGKGEPMAHHRRTHGDPWDSVQEGTNAERKGPPQGRIFPADNISNF
jgi:hypothetical protein